MRRPVLGVTTGCPGRRRGLLVLREEYARAVEQAGGVPVLLPPAPPEDAAEVVRRLDGLLLTGGGDVDPRIYDRPPHERLGDVDSRRDLFEIALVVAALAEDLPVLGICRGLQLLNVATGGTLLQDIPAELGAAIDHRPKTARYDVAHSVRIVKGSLLHRITQRESMDVNSIHHQAILRMGDGLVVSAEAADGIVEAAEMTDRRFVLGVQWHPESACDRGLSFGDFFQPLVVCAAQRRRQP